MTIKDSRTAGGSTDRAVAGITFRPMCAADAEQLCDILLAARSVDGPREPVSRDEIRHLWFDHPGVNLERDSLLAVAGDGRPIGAVAAFARDVPISTARVFLSGAVHPAFRGRGIGTHLLRHGEARARTILASVGGGIACQIDGESPAGALDRVALFEREGFRRARAFVTMHRDLADPIPSPPLADGLAMINWEPGLDDATRGAHNDAFRDHWGSDPLTVERWQHFVANVPGFRADASWLALAVEGTTNPVVAGYTLATLSEDGPDGRVGWLGTIGVRREWRHQGVASALIARSLQSLAAAGATRVGLDVDAENPTGAVRVYAALGFEPSEELIIFSKIVEA